MSVKLEFMVGRTVTLALSSGPLNPAREIDVEKYAERVYCFVSMRPQGMSEPEQHFLRQMVERAADAAVHSIAYGRSEKSLEATSAEALYAQLQFRLPENVRHHADLTVMMGKQGYTVMVRGPAGFSCTEPLEEFPTRELVDRLLCLA